MMGMSLRLERDRTLHFVGSWTIHAIMRTSPTSRRPIICYTEYGMPFHSREEHFLFFVMMPVVVVTAAELVPAATIRA